MKKKVFAVMAVLLVLSAGLFAAGKASKINNYINLSSGVDIGWHTDKTTVSGTTISKTTVTDYIPVRVEGVNYFCDYAGITYGIGLNIPFAMWDGDQKEDKVFDILPVEFAVRAGLVGRYPVSKKFSVGGRFGVSVNGGLTERSTTYPGGYTTSEKNMITRIDLFLGAMCEFAFSDSMGLVAGFDVTFPTAAFKETTIGHADGSETKTSTRPDYKRYGINPYVGIAFMF